MLEAVGFSRDQAETSVKILVEIMEDKLATKEDLRELRTDMNHSFKEIRSELQQVEMKLTIRMGTMLAASIAILTAIQKLT